MRIKNFIKKYPFTVFNSLLVAFCLTGLVMEDKSYAYGEKSNPNCRCTLVCKPKSPTNTYPLGKYPCEKGYFDVNQDPYCLCKGNEYEYKVMAGVWESCRRKRAFSCDDCSVTGACNPPCVKKCTIYTYYSHCKMVKVPGGNGIECQGCEYDYKDYDSFGSVVYEHKRECISSDCA